MQALGILCEVVTTKTEYQPMLMTFIFAFMYVLFIQFGVFFNSQMCETIVLLDAKWK